MDAGSDEARGERVQEFDSASRASSAHVWRT